MTSYLCAEQYMMAEKARVMGDQKTRELIMAETGHPKKYRALGRKVKPWDEAKWKESRTEIVYRASQMKFSQNEKLKQTLLATKDSVIAEASPFDRIWGIGLKSSDTRCQDQSQWRG